MKYRILITAFILTISLSSFAQKEEKNIYPIAISFQSECCGVPSDSAVNNFVKAFKKKFKIKKISAYHIGPMGKEGEYVLAFKLSELNKKQAKAFISGLKKVKKYSSDKGILSFEENYEVIPGNVPQRATTQKIIL